MNYDKESLDLHKKHQGKIRIAAKMDVHSTHDLSLVYSPGVAAPCKEIAADEEKVWDYTIKGNCVAIVTDGRPRRSSKLSNLWHLYLEGLIWKTSQLQGA